MQLPDEKYGFPAREGMNSGRGGKFLNTSARSLIILQRVLREKKGTRRDGAARLTTNVGSSIDRRYDHGYSIVGSVWAPGRVHRPVYHAGATSGGILMTILVGIAGAVVGGFIASQFGWGSVTGFDIRSFAIATGGAVLLL